ncbi:uncharacterized protein ISCGN_012062 [Ixodes scapularis]
MELAGLKKALIFLDSHGVTVKLLVTDRHVQAKAFMRKEMPHIVHEFDVWHVGKGVKKELLATLKTAIYAELALWRRSVENHLYWVAASSEGDPRMIVPKWLSILNHVRDIHIHSNPLYPVCAHGELQPREWLDDGVKKELLATLKTAIYAELALWRRSVENHLYWVAASSEGDPRMIVPKWLSILNHVRDIHIHSNPLYPVCAHGELQPREWLDDEWESTPWLRLDELFFVGGVNIPIKICLGTDLKFILIVMGQLAASLKYPCPFCFADVKDRADPTLPLEHFNTPLFPDIREI